jgi:Protein of unknown function (DUF2281)
MIAQTTDSIEVREPIEISTMQNLLETIQSTVQTLSTERQQQVLDFVEFLAQQNSPQPPQQTIWEKIDETMAKLPDEVWDDSPTDGSYQHDRYLYGTPKREL